MGAHPRDGAPDGIVPDARIVTPDPSASLKPATKILARVPRIRGKGRTAIVIASDPGQLYAIAQPRLVARRYAEIYGWVIDSFWDDRIPAIATNGTYNTVFVADRDERARLAQCWG